MAARMRLRPASSIAQKACTSAGPMSPLTSTPGLPHFTKRASCTLRAASTRARIVAESSPPSSEASFWKGTRTMSR